MNKCQRIFVTGHRGMVGGALVRALKKSGYENIVVRTRAELDLTNQVQIASFFRSESIDQVYVAAAKVGGIYANATYPADFIYQNLLIEANLIHQAYEQGVRRLMFLGSSCIYPKFAEQPIKESALLGGALEPTNEPYAIAKIAGIKLCESYNRQHDTDFRSVMPTNLYGYGDNYHPNNSHVIPGILRRMHDAKENGAPEVVIWGSGTVRREFLFVEDLAEAVVYLMQIPQDVWRTYVSDRQSHVNVGTGTDVTIRELATLIAQTVGYTGRLVFDNSKPDGTPRKLLDVSRLTSLGYVPRVALAEGLRMTYEDFQLREPQEREVGS